MVKKTCGYVQEAHLFAVFNHCISIIRGKHTVYLRLPSEDLGACLQLYRARCCDGLTGGRQKGVLVNLQRGHACMKYRDVDTLVQVEKQRRRICSMPREPHTPRSPEGSCLSRRTDLRRGSTPASVPTATTASRGGALKIGSTTRSRIRFALSPGAGPASEPVNNLEPTTPKFAAIQAMDGGCNTGPIDLCAPSPAKRAHNGGANVVEKGGMDSQPLEEPLGIIVETDFEDSP